MAKYTGHTITSDSALGGMVIERSLRFNRADSAHLTYTPASASSDRTKITISVWVKKCGINEGEYSIFHGGTTSNDRSQLRFYTSSGFDNISWAARVGGSWILELYTTAKFRDPSSWYHIVARCDTTNGTANIYVNGEDQDLSTSVKPSGSQSLTFFNNVEHQIGERGYDGSGTYMNGYMAEMNVIQGQALDPSYFGFTDTQTGIWMPKRYEGTYGDGFYLDFSDNTSTTTLGIDKSPNGNDFTANNFSVSAGTGNDSLIDTPSNNFCTLNAVNQDSNTTLTEGNLKAAGSSSTAYSNHTHGTIAKSSGRWYYEVEYTANAGGHNSDLPAIGWARTSLRPSDNPTVSGGLCYRPANADYIDLAGNDTSDDKPQTSTGNVIQVAIDLDAGKIWFGNGGTYFESGNPSTGANATLTFTGGAEELTPFVRSLSSTFNFNFGQRPFSYTPPTGFNKLSSSDSIPNVPSVVKPQKFFDTLLYSGNSSTQTITGLEFKPDFVWVKRRNGDNSHIITDSVRGVHKYLVASATNTENDNSIYLTAFNNGGFTSGNNGDMNVTGRTYVAWCWKAGGNSNTFNIDGTGYATAAAAGLDGGSLDPTGASINTESGFSILTYTGTDNVSETIAHGLGKKPAWIMVKARNVDGQDWIIYNKNLDGGNEPATHTLKLNGYGAEQDLNDVWQDTEPTSSLFTIGTEAMVNHQSGHLYVAYCWAEIPGFSKFGVYTGNGSSEGTYVELGFRPAFVMTRGTHGTSWYIYDNKRNTSNVVNLELNANNNQTEATFTTMDFLASGFKLRTSNDAFNYNNYTYVYMAFAEQPGATSFDTFANAR